MKTNFDLELATQKASYEEKLKTADKERMNLDITLKTEFEKERASL